MQNEEGRMQKWGAGGGLGMQNEEGRMQKWDGKVYDGCNGLPKPDADGLAPSFPFSRPCGLRYSQILFASGLLRSRSVGRNGLRCRKSFSRLPKSLKSQVAQIPRK